VDFLFQIETGPIKRQRKAQNDIERARRKGEGLRGRDEARNGVFRGGFVAQGVPLHKDHLPGRVREQAHALFVGGIQVQHHLVLCESLAEQIGGNVGTCIHMGQITGKPGGGRKVFGQKM